MVTPGSAGATYTTGNVAFDNSATTFTLPQGAGPQVINLTVSVHTAQKLYVRANSVNMPLNNDVALVADSMNTFVFIAHGMVPFSFQLGGGTTINYFIVTTSRQ